MEQVLGKVTCRFSMGDSNLSQYLLKHIICSTCKKQKAATCVYLLYLVKETLVVI